MKFNHIYILGAGAIGSVYGAFLSQNNRVTLIGRPSHMNAIQSNGLDVVGDRTGTYSPATSTVVTEIPPKTLLMICLKAYDLQKSLAAIRSLIREDTVLLLLQNGLGIEDEARLATKGKGRLIRGIVGFGAELQEPGKVQVSWNVTMLSNDAISKQIAKTFEISDLAVLISEEFQTDIWRKVIINCVTNPLSAILRVQTAELVSPSLRPLLRRIVNECIEVGAAEGIELDTGILQLMEHQLPRYQNRTSMFQDILHGRKTEIRFLNGKIVEIGKSHNIPTPVNATLTNMVRFMERRHT